MTLDINHRYYGELEKERKGSRLKALKNTWSLNQTQQYNWAKTRGLNPGSELSLKEKAGLKEWFHDIDLKHTGKISLLDLLDPMLTSGFAKKPEECIEVFHLVDKDNTGTVDMKEFLDLISIKKSGRLERMRFKKARENKSSFSAEEKNSGILHALQKLQQDEMNSLSLATSLGVQRRSVLMKCLMPHLDYMELLIEDQHFNAIHELLFHDPETRHTIISREEQTKASSQKKKLLVQKKRVKHIKTIATKTKHRPKPKETKNEQYEHVLPIFQITPIINTKVSNARFRCAITCSTRDEMERFVDLVKLDKSSIANGKAYVQGSNMSVANKISAQAHRCKQFESFFQVFMFKSTESLISASKEELKNASKCRLDELEASRDRLFQILYENHLTDN